MNIEKKNFGYTKNGEEVLEYIIRNRNNISMSLISYGAAIRTVVLPDGTDIVLGFDSISGYEKHDKYMGAVIGRCANRIKNGKFVLNGTGYSVAVNNGTNHLHGGEIGFDKKVWDSSADNNGVTFTLFSTDGEENYPGDLTVKVKYALSDDNEIIISYWAESTKDTLVNLTNHTYFNLNGNGTVDKHKLRIFADDFTGIDNTGCSDGSLISVEGTPMDFRTEKEIGRDIESDFQQILYASGYDHNFVLKHEHSAEMRKAATVSADKASMEVWTDQPGMHFYSGNFLDRTDMGKNNTPYKRRSGFALETQDFPDAVNHKDFPSPILRKGEIYKRKTIFKIIL